MKLRKIKPEKMGEMEMPMAKDMPKEHFPSFNIGLEHLPEAKNWEIGKKYSIELEVVQTSMDMHKNKDGKEMGMVGFDIVSIGAEEASKESGKKERYA